MTTPREWTFGTHRAVFEAPDTLLVRFNGPTTVDQARELIAKWRAAGQAAPKPS